MNSLRRKLVSFLFAAKLTNVEIGFVPSNSIHLLPATRTVIGFVLQTAIRANEVASHKVSITI